MKIPHHRVSVGRPGNRQNLPSLLLLCFLFVRSLGHSALPPATTKDLGNLEVFTDGFPRTLLFRSGQIVDWQEQGLLEQHLGMFDADTRKYVGEETPFRPDWIEIMSRFKAEHPRKLSLVHLNGEARGVYRKAGHRFFPGHWTFYPGEVLIRDLDSRETVLPVSDTTLFSSRRYRKRERGQLTDDLNPPIIIVPLRSDGSKDWAQAEYADIRKIDEEAGVLHLDRGRYFSRARHFQARQAYIAPIHSEYWGSGTMWTLNLSSRCPRDPAGKTAGDLWLEEILEWCGPGGPAEHVDGIGFDVIFFRAKRDAWDLSLDGRSDAGVDSAGLDFNTEGQYALLQRLRGAMGDGFLLTSDSWDPKMQRAVGIFNGMESEGLCMPNDGWRKIAQTINTQRYWAEQGNAKYHYSYITSKLRHPDDMEIADQLYRVGLGTACILGVSYTQAGIPRRKDGLPMIPEMHRGAAHEPNWLGQPVGAPVLIPKTRLDLLRGEGAPFSADFLRKAETEHCTVSLESDGSLLVVGNAANPHTDMVVTFRDIEVPRGDLSLFFEALAEEPLTGYDALDRIPRQILVHASGMPDPPGDQVGNRPMYNDILALMGTGGWQENCAYFRKAGDGPGVLNISFRIEDQGRCKIRNLTAHPGLMGLAREFEHGVVLVNASRESLTFDLPMLLPSLEGENLWRLMANPADYLPSPATERMLRIHNGKALSTSQVKLPPLEGFFLSKIPPTR
jgi:hypothetical protein